MIGKFIQYTFIIAVLAVGGYFGYNWLTNTHAEPIVETEPVETVLVDTVYASNRSEADVDKEILDIMDASDGQFFYLEEYMDHGNNINIYKTDIATFNEKVGKAPDAEKASKKLAGGIKSFLNMNYKTMINNPEIWFGSLRQNDFRFNYKWPAGDFMYNYFKDNEIVLSCKDYKVTKMATMIYGAVSTHDPVTGQPIVPQTSYNYYVIGEGTLTTKNKIGDPNGYFPEMGESEIITIKQASACNDTDSMLCAGDIHLEN